MTTQTPKVCEWVKNTESFEAAKALKGGFDYNRLPLYIARVHYKNRLVPGKGSPDFSHCWIGHEELETRFENHELLISDDPLNFTWIHAEEGRIPSGAIQAGYDDNKKPLYVGRVWYDGILINGYVNPPESFCYVSVSGKQIKRKSYEILVCKDVLPNP